MDNALLRRLLGRELIVGSKARSVFIEYGTLQQGCPDPLQHRPRCQGGAGAMAGKALQCIRYPTAEPSTSASALRSAIEQQIAKDIHCTGYTYTVQTYDFVQNRDLPFGGNYIIYIAI